MFVGFMGLSININTYLHVVDRFHAYAAVVFAVRGDDNVVVVVVDYGGGSVGFVLLLHFFLLRYGNFCGFLDGNCGFNCVQLGEVASDQGVCCCGSRGL